MRKIVIPLVILAILVGGVYVGYNRFVANAESGPTYQTTTVRRGTLVATVSAAGTIQASAQTALSFQTSGKVVEVHVAPGDVVKQGQALMKLDATELQLAVDQAQVALDIAKIKLEQLKAGPTPEQIASAQAALESARANLAKLLKGPDPHDIRVAELNVEVAKNNLWQAQAQRDADRGNPMTPDWQLDLDEARINNAQNQLDIALQNLEKAKAGPTVDQIAAARAQVAQAEANLKALQNTPSSYDVAIAEAQVRQAELSLQQAQNNLSKAVLTVPYDGIVAAVNYRVGDQAASAQPAVVLIDQSALSIQVNLAEVDIPKIQLGQPVNITLDALPDRSFTGHVSYVSPAGTNVQGVVNFAVTVTLDDADSAVKPGMTATANIIVDRRDNALLVPNRAIRSQGGQRVVQVLYNGQVIAVPVQLGLSNDTATEVLSGLQEGDQVILNTTTTVSQGFGPGGGFFIGR